MISDLTGWGSQTTSLLYRFDNPNINSVIVIGDSARHRRKPGISDDGLIAFVATVKTLGAGIFISATQPHAQHQKDSRPVIRPAKRIFSAFTLSARVGVNHELGGFTTLIWHTSRGTKTTQWDYTHKKLMYQTRLAL
jgi:hypothetical protein